MGYFIYQTDEKSCALASLRMILVNRTHNPRFRYLRIEGEAPYSLLSLVETSKRYGFCLSFFKRDPSKGFFYPDKRKQDFLVTLKRESSLHLVYVRKITKNHVCYYDPSKGKVKEDLLQFTLKWTGIYGVMERIEKRAAPPKMKSFGWAERFSLYLCSLLANVSLLIGFYFFYDEGNLLLPIFSFLSFGFISILSHLVRFNLMRKFDSLNDDRLCLVPKEKRMEVYKNYCDYKVYELSTKPDALSSLLSGIGLSVLLILNNPYFALPLFVSILLRLITSLLFKNKIKKVDSIVKKEEKAFLEQTDYSQAKERLEKAQNSAATFFLKKEYQRVIDGVTLLSSSLLSLIGAREITLNFYLFHLFSLLGVLVLLNPMMNFLINREDYQAIELRYLDNLPYE